MIRELFSIGPIAISPFGVLLVAAFLAAYGTMIWTSRRLELGNEEDASALLLAAGIGGVVGGKIYYAALYGDWRLLFDRSGLVFYGALVLGAAGVYWTSHKRGLPFARVADAGAPAVAVGYAIGRVGCFLVGDDYGRPTDLPWGVGFPEGLPGPTTAGFLRAEYGLELAGVDAAELVAVHPTQLYESLAGLFAAALGIWLIRRGPAPGMVALAVFSLLAVERFGVEFLRLKDDRFFAGFTLAQLISIALLLFFAFLATRRRRSEAAA
ncbi:MAG: prolipoprotein diacylglyceryl transferase [Thermoanaerobaculia bacterium]